MNNSVLYHTLLFTVGAERSITDWPPLISLRIFPYVPLQ